MPKTQILEVQRTCNRRDLMRMLTCATAGTVVLSSRAHGDEIGTQGVDGPKPVFLEPGKGNKGISAPIKLNSN